MLLQICINLLLKLTPMRRFGINADILTKPQIERSENMRHLVD
jgi:hypothetical protein